MTGDSSGGGDQKTFPVYAGRGFGDTAALSLCSLPGQIKKKYALFEESIFERGLSVCLFSHRLYIEKHDYLHVELAKLDVTATNNRQQVVKRSSLNYSSSFEIPIP
jgi:hypothetical protein